ncbi:hypothetical protein F4814DRAFT_449337 [Daldinia grandis]|nr:hypothetical protein F4814DRAFT_449337 [Daldinia grandis]
MAAIGSTLTRDLDCVPLSLGSVLLWGAGRVRGNNPNIVYRLSINVIDYLQLGDCYNDGSLRLAVMTCGGMGHVSEYATLAVLHAAMVF